jgi:wobble nucleotide-excising tRNase
MEFLQTDVTGIVREAKSGALVNTNVDALVAYKKKKTLNKVVNDLNNDHKHTQEKLLRLEKDVSEIKQLLLMLVNKEQ